MEIDINAPIIPFEGLGGIKLYSTREELRELLESEETISYPIFDGTIEYKVANKVLMFFNLANNKLFKISTLEDYKGKLFDKIGVGMTEEELLKADSSFVYNDFEEFWESDKGVVIETDSITHKVIWIGVYIPELQTEEFKKGMW